MRDRLAATAVNHLGAGRTDLGIHTVHALIPYAPDEMMLLDFCHQLADIAQQSIARQTGRPMVDALYDPAPLELGEHRTAAFRFATQFVAAHTRRDLRTAAELFGAEVDFHSFARARADQIDSNVIIGSIVNLAATVAAIVRGMR